MLVLNLVITLHNIIILLIIFTDKLIKVLDYVNIFFTYKSSILMNISNAIDQSVIYRYTQVNVLYSSTYTIKSNVHRDRTKMYLELGHNNAANY